VTERSLEELVEHIQWTEHNNQAAVDQRTPLSYLALFTGYVIILHHQLMLALTEIEYRPTKW